MVLQSLCLSIPDSDVQAVNLLPETVWDLTGVQPSPPSMTGFLLHTNSLFDIGL